MCRSSRLKQREGEKGNFVVASIANVDSLNKEWTTEVKRRILKFKIEYGEEERKSRGEGQAGLL